MHKKLYIIIAIVVVTALISVWWFSRRATVEAPLNTSDIEQNLEELDVGDINTEFEQIDQEMNTL